MAYYFFTIPLLTGSTKEIEIKDDNQNIVGYIKRFYKNKAQRGLDFIFNNSFIVNVKAFDKENNVVCEIHEKNGLKQAIRSQWIGESDGLGEFKLLDSTRIKTNPRLDINSNSRWFRMKKDLGDKRVLLENESAAVIAEISYKNIVSARNLTLNVKTNDLTFLEIASLYYLFNLRE